MSFFSKIFKFAYIGKSAKKNAPTYKAEIGRLGEDAAAKWLKKNAGMKILRRNFRSGKLETDIVARDGNCIAFVEVKTRADNSQTDGYYAAVETKKRRNLKLCAKKYIDMLSVKPESWRFDVVEVVHSKDGGIVKITHFKDVGFQ